MIKSIKVFVVVFLLLGAHFAMAQGQKFKIGSNSKMLIEGTSNVRDWGVEVPVIKGEATMADMKSEAFSFVIRVNDMKGTVSGMMDHVKKALKADTYPEIKFALVSQDKLESGISHIKGNITAAGTTKLFEISGTVKKNDNGYTITGKKAMKMTDFGITPPKALLGAVKAADDITVNFEIDLN